MSENYSRLPKWAQRRIGALTRERDDWRRRALEPEMGATGRVAMRLYPERKLLPDNARIEFYREVPSGKFAFPAISVHWDRQSESVVVSAERQLVIEPCSGNVARVR